jgi:hypothetical protein
MKKLVLAAMILASAALPGSAFARTYTIHGTICRPLPDNLAGAEYDQYGVHNIGGAILTVECPLPLAYPELGTAPAVTSVQVTVYDRSTSLDVSCVLEHMNVNGVSLMSLSNKTFGGGPGSGPVDLPFTPDPGSGANGFWRLRCTLPGAQPGGSPLLISQTSLLVSITVKTSE